MPVKHFLRRGSRVRDTPMIYRGVCDDANRRLGNPLPENNIFVILMCLDFLFRVNVENLKSLAGCSWY
jgi:hypothetical protein